jgi:hypothetical protein
MGGLDIFIFVVMGYYGLWALLPKIFGEPKRESTPEQDKWFVENSKKTDEWLKKINS